VKSLSNKEVEKSMPVVQNVYWMSAEHSDATSWRSRLSPSRYPCECTFIGDQKQTALPRAELGTACYMQS